ncbi:hypothetical protein ABPG72_011468 [Tetrahymena utriculariae]
MNIDENDISDVESNKDDDQDIDIQESQKRVEGNDEAEQEEGQLGQIKLKQIEYDNLALKQNIHTASKEKETDSLVNNEKPEQLKNNLSESKNNNLQKQQQNDEKIYNNLNKIIYLKQKKNFQDEQKSKITIQDFEEDQYLSRLEEGTADFYNYLFLDIKNEESLNEEEKNYLKQIKFQKSVFSIEEDIFRKKKFDSFVIEKRISSKNNPKKVKTRIELIINKFHFEDIPSFLYLTNIIDQYSSIITSIKFMRLGRIKDNLFSMLFQKLKDLDRIQILLFYDTALYPENLEEIKLLMNWQLGKVKKIGFVQNFLNQLDLNFLFDTSLTRYPRNNQQLNDIYFLKHFNSNLVKSYSLIMIDKNYISQSLQTHIQQNFKPISQKGTYYNSNLRYCFKFYLKKFGIIDLEIYWLNIKQSIENGQIEDLKIEVYNYFITDLMKEVGHHFDLTIYSRKSLRDININLIYFNINQVEIVLSQRKKISMYCLTIQSNIDNYLKDLKLRDLLVQKYIGATFTIIDLGILFILTLQNITLMLSSEIANISQGFKKRAPYLKMFSIKDGETTIIDMNNLLKGIDWSKFQELQKIKFFRCNFDEESSFDIFNQLNDTSLEKIKLASIQSSEKFLHSVDWKRFKKLSLLELQQEFFNKKSLNTSFYVTDICEPIAHQLKTLNLFRLNIDQKYLGVFTASNYTKLTTFQSNNAENNKKDENADLEKMISSNKENKLSTQKDDMNNQEEKEEGDILDEEQKTEKIYQKIQNKIIKDASKEDKKKQVFAQKQEELTDQIIYKSFERVSIKLESDYLFSKSNCENIDLKYLDKCVKSINLTTLSPLQPSNLEQQIIFSKILNVEEVFCWFYEDQDNREDKQKEYNSKFENIIKMLSAQLKVLDLRRSSISLANIFDSQNSQQFSQLRILKRKFQKKSFEYLSNYEDDESYSDNDDKEEKNEDDDDEDDDDDDDDEIKKEQISDQKDTGSFNQDENDDDDEESSEEEISQNLSKTQEPQKKKQIKNQKNQKLLKKLDISRNKNFFLQDTQIFKNMLNQIAWNLQELNVSQKNICLETNLSNFEFAKLQKLQIFKAKSCQKIFKASQYTETRQSAEALQSMNAIIPQLQCFFRNIQGISSQCARRPNLLFMKGNDQKFQISMNQKKKIKNQSQQIGKVLVI